MEAFSCWLLHLVITLVTQEGVETVDVEMCCCVDVMWLSALHCVSHASLSHQSCSCVLVYLLEQLVCQLHQTF